MIQALHDTSDTCCGNRLSENQSCASLTGQAFLPTPVLPVTSRGGNFADVNFRIKIGGKMLAMITAITIEYVEGMHLADQMFFV